MKNELIAFVLITCILIVVTFPNHPLNEISLKDFSGVYGVIGYIIVKKIVDAYFEKKR